MNKILPLAGVGLFLVVSGFSRTVSAQRYTFEEVASGLKHQDAATRIRAIQILKDADYQEAAAPIGDVLGDSVDNVQLAAIDAERSLFTTRPISRRRRIGYIIEQRSSVGSSDAAAEAQLSLKPRRVPREVLAGLVLALSDSNPRVRGEAIGLAVLLAPIACDVRSPGSVRLQTDPNDQACGQIGNVLIENINSREVAVRRAAMQALGRFRYSNAVQALLDQLSYHQKGPDAAAAIEGLAGIGHAGALSVFEQLLGSSSADMRRLGVEGLARSDDATALGTLQPLAQTERSAAVLLALHYANAMLKAPGSSTQQLVESLRDARLRPFSIAYLLDLSPTRATDIAASLSSQDVVTRRLIADILGFSRDTAMLAPLAEAAKDADPDVAAAAQRAVERLKLQ